jgi:hypothetical protein
MLTDLNGHHSYLLRKIIQKVIYGSHVIQDYICLISIVRLRLGSEYEAFFFPNLAKSTDNRLGSQKFNTFSSCVQTAEVITKKFLGNADKVHPALCFCPTSFHVQTFTHKLQFLYIKINS